MTDKNNLACAKMLEWLEKRHATIMECENQAYVSMDAGDIDDYRAKMRSKAENLASIYQDASSLLDELPQNLRHELAENLETFANGANNALRLNSVFYMSALLYPDEYKSGEPDNLARCVADFRIKARKN